MITNIRQQFWTSDIPANPEVPKRETVSCNPIFVYQMGRVGSVSIQSSLIKAYKSLSLDVQVLHGHYLDNFELVQSRAEQDLANASQLIAGLENHRKLRERLLQDPSFRRLKIITLVRDIVARNVSTFFYALPEFIPDWEEKLQHNSLTVDYLHGVYLSKNAYKLTAMNWFDEQLKPVFDIDVYAMPFPKDLGYKIYSSPKADLLVMRLENLNKCAEQAVSEFLGLQNFVLSRENTGDDRKTGQLQRMFKTNPLPPEYIKKMYKCKLSRHFYTEAELDAFARNWTGQNTVHSK
jgi:hypothetical protein